MTVLSKYKQPINELMGYLNITSNFILHKSYKEDKVDFVTGEKNTKYIEPDVIKIYKVNNKVGSVAISYFKDKEELSISVKTNKKIGTKRSTENKLHYYEEYYSCFWSHYREYDVYKIVHGERHSVKDFINKIKELNRRFRNKQISNYDIMDIIKDLS